MRMTIMLAAIVDTGDLVAATCSANPAKWRIRREPIKKIALVLTTLGLCLAAIHHAKASLLYWADQNTADISRVNLDGGEQQVLATGQLGATGLALDVAAGQMYWTRQGSGGVIQRANLDGTGQQTLVGQVSAFGIALDTTRDQMYWTDTGQIRDIRRANFDGTGQQVLVIGQNIQDTPNGIALDITSNKMYWVNQFGGTLLSANLDGTGQQLVFGGLTEPTNIAIDLISGQIYIADFQGAIERANLDGTGLETLVTGQFAAEGIALDIADDKMYWAAQGGIRRANLDGTGLETVVSGLNFPIGIALQIEVSEPSSLALLGVGLIAIGALCRRQRASRLASGIGRQAGAEP